MKLSEMSYAGRQLAAGPLLISGLLIFTLVGSVGVAEACLTATVETSQSSYVLGERIEVTVTAFNDSDNDVTLRFPSSFQTGAVLDEEPLNAIGFAIFTERTMPAHGSADWGFEFTQSLDIGVHQVKGFIASRSARSSQPASSFISSDLLHGNISPGSLGGPGFFTMPDFFEITAPKPVIDDVFIDFETYPDGSSTRGPYGTRGIWQDAYAERGVRLSTTGYSTFSLGMNITDEFSSDNTVLRTNRSKRNIRADFDMPVFEVSARVGTAQGRSVTMKNFDDQGNVLDSITSSITSEFPTLLVDPVTLTSDVPIGSVEWSSSDQWASVAIDDLFLDVRPVPEPSGVALVAMLLMSLLSIRGQARFGVYR
jgi:hypothetical protein